MALKFNSPFLQGLKGLPPCLNPHGCCRLSLKPTTVFHNTRPRLYSSLNMFAGNPDDSSKFTITNLLDKTTKLWDASPQPVKSFPWNRALENFIQVILDLILAVVKYLSVPLFAVTSLSEMSYCAHERKLKLVPIPLLIGFLVAGVLTESALVLSPLLKDADVPWHLIVTAIFFVLVKLPGPYCPYWKAKKGFRFNTKSKFCINLAYRLRPKGVFHLMDIVKKDHVEEC
ncbi:hypothetical protein ACFE04_021594 [Oxalis oulophora]